MAATEQVTIFTVGHSRHPADHFFALLARHQIQVLVDVRSRTYSRFSPQFNKKHLEQAVRDRGLEYLFLGRSLGGRPEGSELYNADGALNYARRAVDRDFLAGIEELLRLAADERVAIMCAEEDPEKCHRWLLVGKTLVARGVSIIHIRGDGTVTPAEPCQQTNCSIRSRRRRETFTLGDCVPETIDAGYKNGVTVKLPKKANTQPRQILGTNGEHRLRQTFTQLTLHPHHPRCRPPQLWQRPSPSQ